MVKFVVPDYAYDITIVEQATKKNNAIIIMPNCLYHNLIDDGYSIPVEFIVDVYDNISDFMVANL